MDQTTPRAPLTSTSNRTFRYLTSFADPKTRRKEKAFLIDGVKVVEEALANRSGVRTVIAAPSLVRHQGRGIIERAATSGTPVLWISERLMDQLSESKTPQPVMAVVQMRESPEAALRSAAGALIVLCHRLQDPGNLGAIIRTAEAVGAAGVAVTASTVDPYNAKCVRASMGSILRLPVVRLSDLQEFLDECKDDRYRIVALTLTGERTLFEVDLKGPTVLIVGQEGAGIPRELARTADLRVRIPMATPIDSLNAAISTAVVLYEALRQRSPGSIA